MTTQKSYSDTRSSGMFSVKYFKLLLRRSWTHQLFYSIVFMFVIPVPLLLMMQNGMPYTEGELTRGVIKELASGLSYALTIAGAFIGLFAGMTTLSHVNSKVSINFYHSLPVKREGLFIMETCVKFINFIAAALLNIMLGFIITTVSGGSPFEYMTGMFGGFFGYAVLFFSLIYFITLLAGMIAGTGSFRFLLTIWMLGIGIGAYTAVIAVIGYNSHTFMESYYFGYDKIKNLSPVIRLGGLFNNPMSGAEIAAYVIATVVIAVVAVILYAKRKSELSGNTVIFKGVGEVFKYVSMFMITVGMGFLFESISETSSAGFLLGAVIGATLTFMLFNTILTKNAKAMFIGLKGLGVFGVTFALFFTFVGFDVLGLDSKYPSPSSLSSITLSSYNSYELEFKDKEDIEFIVSQLEEMNIANRYGVYTYEYDEYLIETYGYGDRAETQLFHQYEYGTDNLEVKFNLPLGLTIARNYYVPTADLTEQFAFSANSDELDEYFSTIDVSANETNMSVDVQYVNQYGDLADMYLYSYMYNFIDDQIDIALEYYRSLADAALEPFKDGVSAETFNKFKVGTVTIGNKQIPVFSDNAAFFAALSNGYTMGLTNERVDPNADIVAEIAETIEKIDVYDTETHEMFKYTDSDEILEIVRNICCSNSGNYSSQYRYTSYDKRYRLVLTYSIRDTAITDKTMFEGAEPEAVYDSEYYNYGNGINYMTSPAVFREGMVPAFVGK